MRIGVVAGELSGDRIGAGLISALRGLRPDIQFEGIGGPAMVAAGMNSLYPMSALSIMGFTEVIGHLPRLLAIRRELAKRWKSAPPDAFIGIDSPDFNLGLERALKAAGIPVIHYVSPSLWAWRAYRSRRLARSTDRVLTLFPFEEQFLRARGVEATFVGHPFADEIPAAVDIRTVRENLGLEPERRAIALLPGSRRTEIRQLLEPFVETALWCHRARPGTAFVLPAATDQIRREIEEYLRRRRLPPDFKLTVTTGKSEQCMMAADVLLLASGTATLEGLLHERPMVVAYRLSNVSYYLARRLLRVAYFSLPNILAGEKIVEEIVQSDVKPAVLGPKVAALLDGRGSARVMINAFRRIKETLTQNANERAAAAVMACIEGMSQVGSRASGGD